MQAGEDLNIVQIDTNGYDDGSFWPDRESFAVWFAVHASRRLFLLTFCLLSGTLTSETQSRHFKIDLIGESSDEEETGSIGLWSNLSLGNHSQLRLAIPITFVWEQEDSDDDGQDIVPNKNRDSLYTARLHQDLVSIDESELESVRLSSQTEQEAFQHFLSQGSAALEQVVHGQQKIAAQMRSKYETDYLRACDKVDAMEAKVREEEEIRKAKIDREERQRIEEQKVAEEEKKIKLQNEKKKEAEREQEKQREALEVQRAKELREKESKPIEIASKAALQAKIKGSLILQDFNNDLKSFCDDKSMKDVRRGAKKFITLAVQQISATQEQVGKKSSNLLQFMSDQHILQQKFCLVTLANKMLSQCEVQVTRLHSFAFPLGEVSVAVGQHYPEFLPVLQALMQKECPLIVPSLYLPGKDGEKDTKYFQSMGFKMEPAAEKGALDGKSSVIIEAEEEYVNRLQGYVRLYAAILQSDNSVDGFGPGASWTYVAHLLNALPACRYSACALDAFLSIAGYKMFISFKSQFLKVMKYIKDVFLQDLMAVADATAVATRLHSYIDLQEYRQLPKGRNMPLRDESSISRA